MRSLIAVLAFAAAPVVSLAAQTPATIDPGMTKEEVVAKLGRPLSVREKDSHTYLFYRNGCEKKCGMNDLVVLDSGKVVDAVFRSADRKYSGTSSSPRMIGEAEARKGGNAGELRTPPKTPEDQQ